MAVSLSATILMTAEHGPVNERLWTLVLELSAQLAANKQQVDALRKQVASLEGQAPVSYTHLTLPTIYSV